MKINRLTIACLVWALAVALPLAGAPPVPAIVLPVQIPAGSAIDGDTMDVDVIVRVRVRLLAADKGGCWAPEKNTPIGKQAAETLKLATAGLGGNILTGTLQVPIHSGDLQDLFTFGRVLGSVWVAGQDTSLGEQQIAIGMASSTKTGPLGK